MQQPSGVNALTCDLVKTMRPRQNDRENGHVNVKWGGLRARKEAAAVVAVGEAGTVAERRTAVEVGIVVVVVAVGVAAVDRGPAPEAEEVGETATAPFPRTMADWEERFGQQQHHARVKLAQFLA